MSKEIHHNPTENHRNLSANHLASHPSRRPTSLGWPWLALAGLGWPWLASRRSASMLRVPELIPGVTKTLVFVTKLVFGGDLIVRVGAWAGPMRAPIAPQRVFLLGQWIQGGLFIHHILLKVHLM